MARLKDLIDKKTIKKLNESSLGQLPSERLMKMKWNPITESEPKSDLEETSKKINEISAFAGLQDVLKNRTSAIEGIKMSKDVAEGLLNWIAMSPFGRRYGKQIKKGRIHSMIGPADNFGAERYMSSNAKRDWKQIVKKYKPKRESIEEGLLRIVFEDKNINELNSRMMSLVNNKDKRTLADVIQNYVFEFADDGFDEQDIQKYMAEVVKSYVRSYYRQATR